MPNRGSWYPLTEQGVQWDERGLPYYHTSDGQRDYIPPIAAAQYRDDPRMLAYAKAHGVTDANPSGDIPGRGFLHDRGTWNSQKGQYDQGLNWDNLLSLAVGSAMGAPFLASALGGAGGAAGAAGAQGAAGGAAFDALPAISSATGAANAAGVGGAGLASGMAGLGGALPSSSIPVSTAMSGPAAIASQGASAGGSSILSNVLKGLKDYGPSVLAGAGAAKNLLQGPPPASQDLERILALIEGRVNATQPLFDSLNTMTQAQLPAYSRKQ